MKFKIIACMNTNHVIGNNGELIYRIPNDLKNFKRITLNSVVIMGRNTFESLPNQRPLNHRINIIVTRNKDYNVDSEYDNLHIVHSLEDAMELCEAYYSNLDCYVIGGGQLYEESIEKDMVDTIYLTTVNDTADGDTYFPSIILDEEWRVFYQSYTQRCRSQNLTYFFTILKKE